MSDGWKHGRGYGRGVIVRMSDGCSHGRCEVRVLCLLEKSSHDALAPVTCVMVPHFPTAFGSPVNQGEVKVG